MSDDDINVEINEALKDIGNIITNHAFLRIWRSEIFSEHRVLIRRVKDVFKFDEGSQGFSGIVLDSQIRRRIFEVFSANSKNKNTKNLVI